MTKPTIQVRTSERRDFAQCPQKWYWAYVDHLTPLQSKAPLTFGDLIHQALALWYIPGKKRAKQLPEEIFEQVWADNEESIYGVWDEEGDFNDAYELAIEMLCNYVAQWGRDERYEIIAPEQAFQVDILVGGEYFCTYVGQLDAVVRDLQTKKLGLLEHKTSKGLPPDFWLPMDEQAGSYWTFAPEYLRAQGHLKKNEDLDFILYNFLRKGKADQRPQNEQGMRLNKDGSVSKQQPSPLFHREYVYRSKESRASLYDRVVNQVMAMEKIRSGEVPVTKNPTKECRYMCSFKDMCQLHEEGADWEAFRDGMFKVWEPYAAHAPIPTEATR